MPEAIYTARPLTDEEKIFAEKNHNLMYRYIRIHELDLEEAINAFIEKNPQINIISIQFQTCGFAFEQEQIYCFSALLLYENKTS